MEGHAANNWGWRDWAGLACLLLVTFFLSNIIAWQLERARQRRIADKTRRLAAASSIKTPVTIVTGFLGSGKTTLVNRILMSHDHGKRIVVIENEAGALSIDDQILRASEQEKQAAGIFVMKNGCMCCSGDGAGPELERVLNHLLELRDEHDFDYVLIETSGLADPAPIMQTFFGHEMCSGRFVLDGVVALVDAKNIWGHIGADNSRWWAHTSEAYRQIAHATTIVLNKVDLARSASQASNVTGHTLERLQDVLRQVNVHAQIVRAEHGDVSLDLIFDQEAFAPSGIQDTFGFGSAGAHAPPQRRPKTKRAIDPLHHEDRLWPGASSGWQVRQRGASTGESPRKTVAREQEGVRRRRAGRNVMPGRVEHSAGVAAVSLRAGPERPVELEQFHAWMTSLVDERWQVSRRHPWPRRHERPVHVCVWRLRVSGSCLATVCVF